MAWHFLWLFPVLLLVIGLWEGFCYCKGKGLIFLLHFWRLDPKTAFGLWEDNEADHSRQS